MGNVINKVQLIAYADRLSGGNLSDLNRLLTGPLNGIFGGIHILPFFDPIDGSDAGFDPVDHTVVDPRLGTWDDIKAIGRHTPIMADLIVNHVSADSREFKDYLEKKENSAYSDFFMTKEDIFPNGEKEKHIDKIYRPRPTSPFTEIAFQDGTTKEFWTTFSKKQIDINVKSQAGIDYLNGILDNFKDSGVNFIRLDAVGYAIKKAGTSCFMIPETYSFIKELSLQAGNRGMSVLVEIHSYFQDQIDIAKHVDFVYDFALPPLILHAIYRKTGKFLANWLKIRPHNAITVLDTHDGIGIIDIGPDQKNFNRKGLIPDEDVDFLVHEMHRRSGGTSKKATGAAASNFDLYQVNSTYFDVLGGDLNLYLLARAIQFFIPGIPQVYYMGLTCESNDMELLSKTNVGRDINRHYYRKEEIVEALNRSEAEELVNLIRIRNERDAFNGQFSYHLNNEILTMTWRNRHDQISLNVDFNTLQYDLV